MLAASGARQLALAQKSRGQALSPNKWPLPGPTSTPAGPPHPRPCDLWCVLSWAVRGLDGLSQIITLPGVPLSVHDFQLLFQNSGAPGRAQNEM